MRRNSCVFSSPPPLWRRVEKGVAAAPPTYSGLKKWHEVWVFVILKKIAFSAELWIRNYLIWIRILDPDPAFQVNPDPEFWWPKYTAENFFDLYLNKNSNLLMSKLQEKPSALKREHQALQKIKFINFFHVCGSFLPSWIRTANPDTVQIQGPHYVHPDPQNWFSGEKRNLATCFFSGLHKEFPSLRRSLQLSREMQLLYL